MEYRRLGKSGLQLSALLLAGFVLFRLFDVWKPWPISWLDRHFKGGMGVMVDDVVAGIFAAAVLSVALALTH